ncbi:efflux RND transporter periplasmic adaptor subunit [sulfur-oxidizing endosymbiont of Gigantopelta aegis]|uniref:efflux RND transporter periplasmic adaptor subunit n=1 Tax=sulfur-oxidizing endosymbiont of Gigantopelta aegis TaxID=2794934 RepID=UPI0018DD3308|nr:efflux RND transporter periplasmic adaptor subunit [sulfur-oxidizing endosymbiont of Gigantopelta aegis]
MKKKIIIPLLIVIAILSGWYFYSTAKNNQHTDQVTLFGNVDIREVNLSFNGIEHISSIMVEEGDHVKKGQELAFLHTELLQANSAQAKAQVEAQKQILAALVAGTRPEDISKAKADLESAKAIMSSSEHTAGRITKLAKKNLASTDEAEHSRSVAQADSAKVKALQAALDLAIAGPRKEVIAQARAILNAKQAEYIRAFQNLKDATLSAPSDGIIRNRILEMGDMASPQTPVFTLALTEPVWIRAYLADPLLGQVKPGMEASIYTDSYPEKNYAGWVGYISPTAEFTPKNIETAELRTHLVYQVRIYSCNDNNELRLGMPATVKIDLKQKIADDSGVKKHCKKAL